MFKEAGFLGAEIAAGSACNPTTQINEKGWGHERWGQQIKNILQIAKEQNFDIDLMVIPSGKLMINTISDVDDPTQGVRLELDGESVTGITKSNPYCGPVPVSEEAVRDATAGKGTCVLYAVTVAKFVDKEKSILSLESAKELDLGTDVIKTGEDSLSYRVTFAPEDDGEYVLFAWWQHPSGENLCGIPQFDFLGKYGTKRFFNITKRSFYPNSERCGSRSHPISMIRWNGRPTWTLSSASGICSSRNSDLISRNISPPCMKRIFGVAFGRLVPILPSTNTTSN